MSDHVHVLSLLRALPERERALAAHLELIRDQSLSAPGCVAYQVMQQSDDDRRWVIHETWINAAVLDDHLLEPYMQDFFDELSKLVEDIDTRLLIEPLQSR